MGLCGAPRNAGMELSVICVLVHPPWCVRGPGGFTGKQVPGAAAAGEVPPILLHPEVLPVLPSQVCSPYRHLGVSSLALSPSFLHFL